VLASADATGSMRTVRVDVAVRPFWSVAIWLVSMTIFETSVPFRRLARRRSLNLGTPAVVLGDDLPLRLR
jgi:hypothetical protein